jgi:hypothetical protein
MEFTGPLRSFQTWILGCAYIGFALLWLTIPTLRQVFDELGFSKDANNPLQHHLPALTQLLLKTPSWIAIVYVVLGLAILGLNNPRLNRWMSWLFFGTGVFVCGGIIYPLIVHG